MVRSSQILAWQGTDPLASDWKERWDTLVRVTRVSRFPRDHVESRHFWASTASKCGHVILIMRVLISISCISVSESRRDGMIQSLGVRNFGFLLPP